MIQGPLWMTWVGDFGLSPLIGIDAKALADGKQSD